MQIVNASDQRDVLSMEFYGRRGFNMIAMTNDNDNPAKDRPGAANTRKGSIRFTYNKKTREVTGWFDRNGPEDGYQWARVGIFSTTGRGGNWPGENWRMKSECTTR